jgi:predicted RNA-binding Zn-ribbon protein involved in translation (DUF1610 family)
MRYMRVVARRCMRCGMTLAQEIMTGYNQTCPHCKETYVDDFLPLYEESELRVCASFDVRTRMIDIMVDSYAVNGICLSKMCDALKGYLWDIKPLFRDHIGMKHAVLLYALTHLDEERSLDVIWNSVYDPTAVPLIPSDVHMKASVRYLSHPQDDSEFEGAEDYYCPVCGVQTDADTVRLEADRKCGACESIQLKGFRPIL